MGTGLVTELRKFVAPEFIFGVGARLQVGLYAKNLGATNVLVVSDPGVIAVRPDGQQRSFNVFTLRVYRRFFFLM